MADKNIKLKVEDLTISFRTTQGLVRAVRGVSFDLEEGETLAIVGESGSGKSVTSRAIMGILAGNGIIDGGSIIYEGQDLTKIHEEDFPRIRGDKIGMIFQDPMSSLNPIMKIGKQITEGMLINGKRLKNRYKRLVHRMRMEVINTKVEIKKTKKQFRKDISTLKKGIDPETLEIERLEFDKEMNRLSTARVNAKSVFMEKMRQMKEELNRKDPKQKAEFEKREAKHKQDYEAESAAIIEEREKAKATFKEISTPKKDVDHTDEIRETKAKFHKDMKALQKKLHDARIALKEGKKEAKAEVDEVWDEAKEKANKKIAEIKKKLEFERPPQNQIDVNKAKIEKEKEALKKTLAGLKDKLKKAKMPAEQRSLKEDIKKAKADSHESIAEIKTQLKTGMTLKERAAIRREIMHEREMLRRVKKVTRKEATERAVEVMNEVGIPEPKKRLKQYPFQFSGGMRQRIVIAIALTANPDLLICDEPTTALDVTIQSQILELIKKLKQERSLSVIFITHDLGVVANMADRVAVMYAGKIVEIGLAKDIFYNPKHPYTWALLSSMPDLDSTERLFAIPGTPPNMLYPPKGDAFADRNPYAMKIDFEKEPPFFKVNDYHYAATWLLHEKAPKVDMPDVVKHRIERMTSKGSEEVSN